MHDEKTITIGRFQLVVPKSHMLDVYRDNFKLYDWTLGEVARLLVAKYPAATVIDIGANVGDSAALLCRHHDLPILCIEGNPGFVTFLRRNLARLPAGIEIAECLLGPETATLPREALVEARGTARIGPIESTGPRSDDAQALQVRLLSDVLREYPGFERPRLIKIDTDGGDFEIILSSMDVIEACHPVLYFEYTLEERKTSLVESIAAISRLAEIGYSKFFIFDNFGNFMQVISDDAASKFRDMNRYLMSHLISGRQIYYLDVCAFSTADEDLAAELYRYQRQLVDENVRRAGWQL